MRINDPHAGQHFVRFISKNNKLNIPQSKFISHELVDDFSKIKPQPNIEWYGFFSENDNIENPDLLFSTLCKITNTHPEFGAVYFDPIIIDGQENRSRSYLPSGDGEWMMLRGIQYNIPFFCKASIFPQFSSKDTQKQLNDGLQYLFHRVLIYHCADPLVNIIQQHTGDINLNG